MLIVQCFDKAVFVAHNVATVITLHATLQKTHFAMVSTVLLLLLVELREIYNYEVDLNLIVPLLIEELLQQWSKNLVLAIFSKYLDRTQLSTIYDLMTRILVKWADIIEGTSKSYYYGMLLSMAVIVVDYLGDLQDTDNTPENFAQFTP